MLTEGKMQLFSDIQTVIGPHVKPEGKDELLVRCLYILNQLVVEPSQKRKYTKKVKGVTDGIEG